MIYKRNELTLSKLVTWALQKSLLGKQTEKMYSQITHLITHLHSGYMKNSWNGEKTMQLAKMKIWTATSPTNPWQVNEMMLGVLSHQGGSPLERSADTRLPSTASAGKGWGPPAAPTRPWDRMAVQQVGWQFFRKFNLYFNTSHGSHS